MPDDIFDKPNPTERLKALMARLRDPEAGCPWDREQDFATIAPYTIEEAYEVADAVQRGDMKALSGELGDLLFQVVFHSQMAAEAGHFDYDTVAQGIVDKMVRRHPHVFADAAPRDARGQTRAWEEQKASERAAAGPAGVLDGIPLALPGLVRAIKLQNRAARVGFDWPDLVPVLAKLKEEIGELEEELAAPERDPDRLAEELGDLLFVVANVARHLKVDAEDALRGANAKFERRFRRIEHWLAEDSRTPAQSSLAEMDALWDRAKAEEKTAR
jgi:MazG family protein